MGTAHAMVQSLTYRSIADFEAMTAKDVAALATLARGLQGSQAAGAERPLRGKNLGLLCDEAAGTGAGVGAGMALFRRAALGLGAQVAQLRPGFSEASTPDEVQHTSRVLGRLYDALECVGMSADLVRRIGGAAGVPVFEALSSPTHPICKLAEKLDPLRSVSDRQCAWVQAVLLGALA